MRWRWLGLPLVLLVLVCCDDDGGGSDAKPGSDFKTDGPVCGKRPATIEEGCFAPPNKYSQDLYFCNCTGYCGGGFPTAACNVQIGDCRVFYDSCIPLSYARCDESVSQNYMLGALCGFCFFREAGGIPDDCDKLSKMGDPSGPADSGATVQ